jgi:hypothetical protein
LDRDTAFAVSTVSELEGIKDMSYDVFYNGEISITPPLTDADSALIAAIVNLERTEETKFFFDAIAASDEPDEPYYGGLLECSDDNAKIIPEEGESNPGAGKWMRLLAKYFFASRGYSLDGQISWTSDDDADDRGCIFAKDQQVEVIDDHIINAGPSWSRSSYASEDVKEAIQNLVDSADSAGCSDDLTVVSAANVEALQLISAGL